MIFLAKYPLIEDIDVEVRFFFFFFFAPWLQGAHHTYQSLHQANQFLLCASLASQKCLPSAMFWHLVAAFFFFLKPGF